MTQSAGPSRGLRKPLVNELVLRACAGLLCLGIVVCSSTLGEAELPAEFPNNRGVASWYGPGFHGNLTANGERFNRHADTAAHTTLPLGSRVCVTNLDNGRSRMVRINDRGPYIRGRTIDLSEGVAIKLGMKKKGVQKVLITESCNDNV